MATPTPRVDNTDLINSPANERPGRRVRAFTPQRKLQLPPNAIPGYMLYWCRGEPGRLAHVKAIGFEFVRADEIDITSFGIATDADDSGSTDMGSRISVAAQEGVGADGQYLRLYLMKLKEEYWNEDMENYIKERIEPIVAAFTGTGLGIDDPRGATDAHMRYRGKIGNTLPEMFTRKSKKTSG